MKLYRITRTQRLAMTLDEAWDFFSSPLNLRDITPSEMDFQVTSEPPERMYAGLLITYRVRPLFGIPVSWVTEITHVDEGRMFVDEQRFGPYRMWHHEHRFTEIEGGVEAFDEVSYVLPFDPVSRLVHALLVRPQLERIFDYRHDYLGKRFGEVAP